MLSQQTVHTIKATVPVVRDHGLEVTKVFYNNLLTDVPQLKEVFNRHNQADGHQAKALAAAVYAYAEHIDDLEVLGPAIKQITQKHASLFVKPEQYDVVGKYLLEAFSQVLGPAFTREVHDAWAAAYSQLAKTMIEAEATLYQQGGDWTDWKDFYIQDAIPESSEITSLVLRPTNGCPLPTYLPGQYVSVRLFIPSLSYSQARQYSLSDRHAADHYRISVKREPALASGSVSNVLHSLRVGDKVQLSKPSGSFTLDPNTDTSSPLVLISAGVGLTPMLSMLNTVVADHRRRPIAWIHGYRNAGRRAFADHIKNVAKCHDAVHLNRFCSRPQVEDKLGVDYEWNGRVDLSKCDAQKDLFLGNDTAKYYVCGPSAFMLKLKGQLLDHGVQPNRIWTEYFGVGAFQPA